MELSVCATEADYEAWRQVRIAVVPGERCDTVAEMRAQDSADRLLMLAVMDGTLVGSGVADRSDIGGGFVAPRVLPEFRRRGVGSTLLRALADHVGTLGLSELRAMLEDPESLAFAEHFGFVERDRQVEQVRAVGHEPPPAALPDGVDVITLDERPELWAASYDTFGTQVLADFATYQPLQITPEQWTGGSWSGDPMFVALHDGELIGCAGLYLDTDRPERAENALTAVRRDWRGRGIAAYLKRRTLRWAADNGITELYTWTQAGNTPMLTLNERLGYVTGKVSISLSRPMPL